MYCKLDTAIIDTTRSFESEYNNSPQFEIYTENKYMGTLSLAIVSISISIAIGDGTEARSTVYCTVLYSTVNLLLFIILFDLLSIPCLPTINSIHHSRTRLAQIYITTWECCVVAYVVVWWRFDCISSNQSDLIKRNPIIAQHKPRYRQNTKSKLSKI